MKSNYLVFIFLFLIMQLPGQQPFGCVAEAYLFQKNDVYGINLASGQSFVAAMDITPGNINAVAYNPTDGYIWGSINSPASSVVRIGDDFSVDTYEVNGYSYDYIGAIDTDGLFYSKGSSPTYEIVDLNPSSASYLEKTGERTLSTDIRIADWAFNSVDGFLYTVEIATNILYKIDPVTAVVTGLGEVPVLSGLSYTYGAVYFDVDGHFYVSANQTGTIYQIKNAQQVVSGTPMESTEFSYGPASSSNDGARCPTAPVPQEICGNGIDDDGDNLIDCFDPSCSEYFDCQQGGVSGGSSGGLESNNRLSQAIAKRNYNRAKDADSYPAIFGNQLSVYDASKNLGITKGALKLKDLVPVGLLNESYAYESSPEDLIDITNAEEVFSVDYFNEENSIASVLALKTSNGVYEHSKFICDRLLGAELNSISTMYIKDQPMLRSIIYREDGTKEFVLSFSIREADGGVIVESHWNLDKYEGADEYYNFQIWSSSINDLVILSEGILDLVETKEPILEYKLSPCPHVFVKRAKYLNGKLLLEIINNDFSSVAYLTGGLRATETDVEQELSLTIQLKFYTNFIELETGPFFDLGFRISTNKGGTPDDLFVSDAPWGYDDSAVTTTVTDYTITKHEPSGCTDCFPIERNLELVASTSEYVSAYRAMTPRFEAINLDGYSEMTFTAKGTGEMEITLIKESIDQWEDQLHATVFLSDVEQDFVIHKEVFRTTAGESLPWEDIKLINFTMRSADGTMEEKIMQVSDLTFRTVFFSSTTELGMHSPSVTVFPNPVVDIAAVTIEMDESSSALLTLLDAYGQSVYTHAVELKRGTNNCKLINRNYPSGNYFMLVDFEGGKRQVVEVFFTN